MCLSSLTKTPVKTENDIIVYKVLMRVNEDEGSKYFAPYVISSWNGGIVYEYKKGSNFPEGEKHIMCFDDMNPPVFLLKSGFLHAFTSILKAERIALEFNRDKCIEDDHEYVVVEMKIPSGSEIYYGNDEDICSDCLIWED